MDLLRHQKLSRKTWFIPTTSVSSPLRTSDPFAFFDEEGANILSAERFSVTAGVCEEPAWMEEGTGVEGIDWEEDDAVIGLGDGGGDTEPALSSEAPGRVVSCNHQ